MPLRILIIEDEVGFREAMCDILNTEGFAASGVGSIASFNAWRITHSCDVLVVDRQLPDGDGLDAVRSHRKVSDGPVIVLTAKNKLADRLEGFEQDVDHYFTKPFHIKEIVALLRRYERKMQESALGSWCLDLEHWRLHCANGKELELTRNEVAILGCFKERAGIIVHKSDLIRALGHDPEVFDPRRLEVALRRLRRKVTALDPDFPLKTVYGMGLSFNARLRTL